jgi:hypothetical protein
MDRKAIHDDDLYQLNTTQDSGQNAATMANKITQRIRI